MLKRSSCIPYPEQETLTKDDAEMRREQEALKVMFKADSLYTEDVHMLMTSAHRLHQMAIKLGTSIGELKEPWPFLFKPFGLKSHFEVLRGINATETLDLSMRNKKTVVLDFFDERKHYKPNIMRAWRQVPCSTQEDEFLCIVLLTMAWLERVMRYVCPQKVNVWWPAQ